MVAHQPLGAISTGSLPSAERIHALLDHTHEQFAPVGVGSVADYIPSLAEADPDHFGLAICGVRGRIQETGDSRIHFSIQSISKAFLFALVCEELGHDAIAEFVGVNNTGLAFNSVIALELNAGNPMNPMVNAGAITVTSFVPGRDDAERWEFILDGLGRFAGRPVQMDTAVYRSESETNHRNLGIATLLRSYGRIARDPDEVTDLYTRQCSILVTAADLAIMGATLAHGGVNPVTGVRAVAPEVCRDTLSVMATTGMYERSGDWLFEVGAPAKSGVSGGIVTVAPGKGALGTYSPPLDAAGNSVRGTLAAEFLASELGLNLFSSKPVDWSGD